MRTREWPSKCNICLPDRFLYDMSPQTYMHTSPWCHQVEFFSIHVTRWQMVHA